MVFFIVFSMLCFSYYGQASLEVPLVAFQSSIALLVRSMDVSVKYTSAVYPTAKKWFSDCEAFHF